MPTPPPHSPRLLPSSSPSSARLRRLAPSPVKIPPTPPRFVSRPRVASATRSPEPLASFDGDDCNAPEHDTVPVDFTGSDTSPPDDHHASPMSPQSIQRETYSHHQRGISIGSNMPAPLSSSSSGGFRNLFAKHVGPAPSSLVSQGGRADLPRDVEMEWHGGAWHETGYLDQVDPFRRISDSPTEYHRPTHDRPLPVLVAFNNDVFGTGRASVQESTSRNASLPLSDSSESSFGHIGMSLESRAMSLESRYASVDLRGPSASGSCGTFGRPESPVGQSQDLSLSEEGDSRSSFTFSAYGDSGGAGATSPRDFPPSPRSRARVRRDTPARTRRSRPRDRDREGTPFLSPDVSTARAIIRTSPPSASSTNLFTPNYSVASRCRPNANFSVDYSASPVPLKALPSLPPSPRTTLRPTSTRLKPRESITSVKSVDTLALAYSEHSPLPSPVHQVAKLGPPPLSCPAEPSLAAQIQHKHLYSGKHAFRRKSKPPLPTVALVPDPLFPSHVRRALEAVPKTTTMTLMVTQEGMREISCTLGFRRIHKPAFFQRKERRSVADAAAHDEKPPKPEMFQESGCLEFGISPKQRPKWSVHHSPMMGLPVLGRCTIDSQERRDYLPRSATLQIKRLGVYTAYGVEDKGRVEWRFDYLVQAKFSASTGEIKPNERLIIPLGFYASPGFFNPDRSSKLHIGNMLKRTVKPKTTSEPIKPMRHVPFPLLKPDGTPAYDHPAWIEAMALQAAYPGTGTDSLAPELVALLSSVAQGPLPPALTALFGPQSKEDVKTGDEPTSNRHHSPHEHQEPTGLRTLPSDEAMSRFYRGITPTSPLTPTSISSHRKQPSTASVIPDLASTASGPGTVKRILRAVTSSRGTPTTVEPFGAKGVGPGDGRKGHKEGESDAHAEEPKPIEEKKTRKRAGTLLSRALGTGDSTKSTGSGTAAMQDNLHAEPAKSPTASTHSQSTLSKVLAPIKSYANLRQATPAAAEPGHEGAASIPSKKGKVHTMKSLSSLVGGNRSDGRPSTAVGTETPPPPVPKIPSIVPVSAHPFATHVVPIPRADIVSRPATAGTGTMYTPEARWMNHSAHHVAYAPHATQAPHTSYPTTVAPAYGDASAQNSSTPMPTPTPTPTPMLHPATSRLIVESTKFHGMVIGQPILIAQNEQMAVWTAQGGFTGPRSGSRDSLKVPLASQGIDEELKEGGKGLKPAPSKSGKGPLQGFRAGIGLRKRPSTAEPGSGRA